MTTAKNINASLVNRGEISIAFAFRTRINIKRKLSFRSRDKKWDEYSRGSSRAARGPPTTPQRMYPDTRYENYPRERYLFLLASLR